MESPYTFDRHKLIEDVVSAMRSALSVNELAQIREKQDMIIHDFMVGKITGVECDRELKRVTRYEGLIQKRTITEFSEVLKVLGFHGEKLFYFLEHENAHMAKALSLGVKPVYEVQLAKLDQEGGQPRIQVQPSIDYDFPTDMPDSQRREVHRIILQAPEVMSEHDRQQLGE